MKIIDNNYFIQKIIKCLILISIINIKFIIKELFKKYYFKLNEHYLNFQKHLNLSFKNKLKSKIRIGIYTYSLKNGGLPRLTSIMLNYLNKIKILKIFLFTKIKKEENEYKIPKNIKRKVVPRGNIDKLILEINKRKINIFIYNFFNVTEINILNGLKNIKTIFYQHQSVFYWIYTNFYFFKLLYKAYQNSKYVISLVPFENDYLFKIWGIRSILMYNFLTYNLNSITPSDLSSKIILMIGRADDKIKRFTLGIKSMKFVIEKIPQCQMKIISHLNQIDNILNLINQLKLENNIQFVDYISSPEIYFKNASLHIFPSLSESFGYVLSETKIYGIPNILVGIDYVSIAKGGTVIIYDDNPKTIANEAIKILKNHKYRLRLGKEARRSMRFFRNDLLLEKWIKLILCIYNGDNYYIQLIKESKKISKNESLNIIENQLKIIRKGIKSFKNINIDNILNFSYMQNFK